MGKQIDWHMEKKVTISLIIALLMNAGGTIWWASRLDATVLNHEQRIAALQQNFQQVSQQQNSTNEKLARIEEQQKYQIDMLKEVRAGLRVK